MNDNYFQGDLFAEKVLEKKKNRPRIFEKYSQQRVLSFVRVPIEYIVIFSIGVLIIIIVAYALGIEKGKCLERNRSMSPESLGIGGVAPFIEDVVVPEENDLEVRSSEIESEPEEIQVEVSPEDEGIVPMEGEKETKKAQEENDNSQDITENVYIVQLASYKTLDPVKKEIQKLQADGVKTGWKKSGDWYQLFARGFGAVDEAKKARNKLIRTYKDCYIKKLR